MTVNSRSRFIFLLSISGIVLCALVLTFWVWFHPSEPVYQGKTLSEWLVPFCRETKKGLDAPAGPEHFQELQPVRQAVLAIGTNAVPFLIARLNHPESALHLKLRLLAARQPYAGLRLENPRVGRIRAIRALAVLGPLAEPALPALQSQLADPVLAVHALYALQAIGPSGMQVLVNQLTNASIAVRLQAGMAIMAYPNQPFGLSSADSLGQTNGQVPAVIVSGLTQLARDPTSPHRYSAIQRLASMGPAAAEAVPALLTLLQDPSPMVQDITLQALRRIQGQPELVISALLPFLQSPDPMMRQRTVRTLGGFWAQRDQVIPALTNCLSDPDFGTRIAAFSTLQSLGYHVSFSSLSLPNSGVPPRSFQPPGTNSFIPTRPLHLPQPPNGLSR